MVNTIHRYKYKAKNKSEIWFWERLLQANEKYSLWKDYGKCEKKKDLWQLKQEGANLFSEKLMLIEINKTKVKMSKSGYQKKCQHRNKTNIYTILLILVFKE